MLRPKIKEYFDVFPAAGDRYQVRGTEYVSVLKGTSVKQVFGYLLPLLNGEYTTAELIEKLRDVASPATVSAFIKRLAESGILRDAALLGDAGLTAQETELYRKQMVVFEIAGQEANGRKCQTSLMQSKVSIVGTGELAARIATECGRAGVGTVAALNLNFELPSPPAASPVVLQ